MTVDMRVRSDCDVYSVQSWVLRKEMEGYQGRVMTTNLDQVHFPRAWPGSYCEHSHSASSLPDLRLHRLGEYDGWPYGISY